MPALSRLRVRALEDLAEGQRFTPARTVVRQIERIERLALEIEREGMYGEEWIAHRITGFKPRIDEPRLIVGAALLADLSALAERLSDAARLEADPRADLVGIDALSARWGVSRKTIERYRRDGLIGRRVRARGGAGVVVHIMFAPGTIDAFARTRGRRFARAGAFTRLTPEERARAARWAARYRRRLGWSVSQAIARAAVRLGRSPGAVRRALDASSDPTMGRRGVAGAREARLAERALRWGVSAAEIGERIGGDGGCGRSRASVHRVVLELRRERIGALDLSTPMDARMSDALARALIEAPAPQSGLGVDRWDTVRDAVRSAQDASPSDPDLERARAGAYHALRWLVARQFAHESDRTARARSLDTMETRLRWAGLLKRWLVAQEVALIVRTIESLSGSDIERLKPGPDVLRAGLAIVGTALEGFDPTRGGRIAASATLPLTRWMTARLEGIGEVGGGATAQARRTSVGRITGWDRGLCAWDGGVREPEYVEGAWARLRGDQRGAIAMRFGLTGDRPREMREIGLAMGISPRLASGLVAEGIVRCRRMAARAGRTTGT